MQGRILKAGLMVLTIFMIAAAIFGSGLGLDFTGGYLIRISSAEPFVLKQVTEKICAEFSDSLGDIRIQRGTDNYNDQLLIRVQYATQQDAERMVQIAAENQPGAYLRSFDVIGNRFGLQKWFSYTLLLLLACLVSIVFIGYRQGLGAALASLVGGLGSIFSALSLLGIAGIPLNEGIYLGTCLLSMAYALLIGFWLNAGAEVKAGLLAGDSVEVMAAKGWADSAGKIIVLTAGTLIFALTGCILAEGVLREYMLAILLSTVSSFLGAACLEMPIYLLFSRKYMLKSVSKKKARAIK